MGSTETAHARQTARPLLSLLAIAAAVAVIAPAPAAAKGDPAVAALQVALHRKGLYRGTIDGVQSPATAAAVRAFARKRGLAPTAAPTALGVMAPRVLGSRVLAEGATGADVAELQFELAWRGFPSGVFDGAFGTHLTGAVKRFQRWAGLGDDGIVGPATVAALQWDPLESTCRHASLSIL